MGKGMLEDKELTEKIIACAFRVHQQLGAGFVEKVYENAIIIELRKLGFDIKQQSPITVYYEGKHVGEYFADILVENKVICELKAAQSLAPEHEMQLVHYLTATGHNIGLLLNFGNSVTVKRKFREYRKPQEPIAPDVNPVNPEKSC
ncbi:MAG: GxxExxY protein [Sulfuricaulis sp.]|nr:GxxExxY protein [Sulfuricaulis sp.]